METSLARPTTRLQPPPLPPPLTSMAQCALALDGLQLGSRQVKVSLAKGAGAGGGGGPGLPGMGAGLPPPPYGAPYGMPGAPGMAALAPYGAMPHGAAAALMPYGAAALGLPAAAGGHRSTQDPMRVAKTIYVDGVPAAVDEDTLATFFAMCGTVLAVRLAPPAGASLERRSWVEFESPDAARVAVQYDGTVMGGSTLRVTPSRTAIHTNGLRAPVAGGGGPPGGLPGPPVPGGDPMAHGAAAAAAAAAASISMPGLPPPPPPAGDGGHDMDDA